MESAEYWRQRSPIYIRDVEGPYHANRLAMVRALLASRLKRGDALIDFGIGDGVFAEYLLEQGVGVDGIDIDQQMITAAERRLRARWPSVALEQGGVDALSRRSRGSVDHLIALNVLAYMSPSEEEVFYREAGRLLRPGGTLTVTHSNELFDLFTLNRYTVNFFRNHFSFQDSSTDVSSLLANADRPDRKVFGIRENPLAYRFKLQRFGFREVQQEFAILHSLPPLLTPKIDFDDINSRTYPATTGWPESERWKLMFACSIFGSASVRD